MGTWRCLIQKNGKNLWLWRQWRYCIPSFEVNYMEEYQSICDKTEGIQRHACAPSPF
jgi:hypothetical protein